ncbi:NAD(P)-dependent oxidoreductase [Actinokineospora sp.]|uniref:NAD(P)-dependent oxidoreductase n=1 Tax=Actinokineospora sp. TaxID=1872133 RepID=UPI0040378BF2
MMSNNSSAPVTVIGLGPMGKAMVRAFLANGHPTTVWNRTAGKADDLVADGAVRAATAAEAVAANELVVLSLTDYQAMYDIFGSPGDDSVPPTGSAAAALAGRVVVNLSSDTPQRTREAATWAAAHGAELVPGGIMVPAGLVGKDGSTVLYSGSKKAFEAHRPTLEIIGNADYRGEDPGLAQLYYQATLDVFLTSLSAYLHGTALMKSAGVSAAEFLPYAVAIADSVSVYLNDAARDIDDGHYPGDLANVTMMGATADHIAHTSAAAGIDVQLPNAVQAQYNRAIAEGHGTSGFASLFEVVKKSAS